MNLTFTVNGEPVRVGDDTGIAPTMRLLDLLREVRGDTGAKEGCGEGECGACAVLVDGELANSCLLMVGQLHGRSVTSIEGLARNDPLVGAFARAGATQCGICTPGMVIAARALLDRCPDPSLEAVREALCGNLCRCTGYTRIYAAVLDAARSARGGPAREQP